MKKKTGFFPFLKWQVGDQREAKTWRSAVAFLFFSFLCWGEQGKLAKCLNKRGGTKKKQEKGSMQKILSVDICQRVANQMQPFFSRLNFPIHQPSVKLLRMQLRNHIHRRTYTLPHKRSGLTLVLTCSSDVYYTWKHTITRNLSLLTIDNNPIPCICNPPPFTAISISSFDHSSLLQHFYPISPVREA